jgi:hypothetical protein
MALSDGQPYVSRGKMVMKARTVTLIATIAILCGLAMLIRPRSARTKPVPEAPGLPDIMSTGSAFSAAVATVIGGTQRTIAEVDVLGDWDGSEDNVADHSGKVDDLSSSVLEDLPSDNLTRVAISEHTIANGFSQDVFYYGDSLGNLVVAYESGSILQSPPTDEFKINLPTVLNAFGHLLSNSQIVITGLAVSPVADLTSFSNVNGSFAPFSGKIGEILYVSFTDNGGGFRLVSNGVIVRSGLLAFPVGDFTSPATSPPGVVSPTGFPVTVGGGFGVLFSVFANPGGIAVDDKGSVYFHQADLIQHTGGNVVELTPVGSNQTRSLATNGWATITTLKPTNGLYGNSSGPSSQVSRVTNYSGTSKFFGNIAALAAGPGNVLYAAVARSQVSSDSLTVRNSEGPFTNPNRLGPTPSMIITMADNTGALDNCSNDIPVADGFADVIQAGATLIPGVNNFRAFVMGNGPDRRDGGPVFGSTSNTQKIGFQVDYTIYSGITVDEEGKVYVISGGTPAGVGLNPSPGLGEILVFPDDRPYDRRADYMDLRGNTPPNGGISGGNQGNGVANRFDYIFWQAPLDPVNNTPVGVAGLSRGFLLYLNRTRTSDLTTHLPNGTTQAANSTSGPEFFEHFDPGHEVAGGDDQFYPFKGDDSDGFAGPNNPSIVDPLAGGFEMIFGGVQSAACSSPWNTFFLNSNGSISFGSGNTSASPDVGSFLSGPPSIAAAWTALNTQSRASFQNTFPVQALGFAGINDFVVRWIDVPQAGNEACGSSNSFEIQLYDDGTGVDENATQPLNPANPIGNNAVPFDLQEGPTDLRFKIVNGVLKGKHTRPDGSAYFTFRYGAMDLLGSAGDPVLVGYSVGDQPSSPPGLCTTANLGNFPNGNLTGDNSQATIFQLFDTGTNTSPAYDLRFEGGNRKASTPTGQKNKNRGLIRFFGVDCSSALHFSCPSSTKPW